MVGQGNGFFFVAASEVVGGEIQLKKGIKRKRGVRIKRNRERKKRKYSAEGERRKERKC